MRASSTGPNQRARVATIHIAAVGDVRLSGAISVTVSLLLISAVSSGRVDLGAADRPRDELFAFPFPSDRPCTTSPLSSCSRQTERPVSGHRQARLGILPHARGSRFSRKASSDLLLFQIPNVAEQRRFRRDAGRARGSRSRSGMGRADKKSTRLVLDAAAPTRLTVAQTMRCGRALSGGQPIHCLVDRYFTCLCAPCRSGNLGIGPGQ
jgi:hypothetical protein